MNTEIFLSISSLLLSAAITGPVLAAGVFVLLMARWKPNENWERPIGNAAIAAMLFCLSCLVILSGIWINLGMVALELPVPFGLLGGRKVFLWNWVTAIWALVCALMGLATVRYSITYLHRENGYVRFMSTALCFLGSMLGSIAADNPVQMAIWWELIGASSLLLIGFYHERPGPCTGAVTVLRQYRIADSGMLLGCGLLLVYGVNGEFASAKQLPEDVRSIAALGFLLAVLVKSAQLPFSGWLPRAMEGPTPSSALFYGGLSLHLGLLLAVRLHEFWEVVPYARVILVICGLATAIDAGFRNRITPDAKNALAWSAMSSIGVLFVLVGLGWWPIVVPLIAGHAIIKWYQLLRSPSTPADLAWYSQSLGLPPSRVAPESQMVNAWIRFRSFLAPLTAIGGAGEDLFLRVVRSPSAGFLWVALTIMPMLNLMAACTWPWSTTESAIASLAICLIGLVFVFIGLASEAEQPFMIGLANASAIFLAGILTREVSLDLTRATIGSAIGLVLGVMLAAQRRGAVTALTGGVGALGNITFLAVLGEHGSIIGATLLMVGVGTVASLILRATYQRLGGHFWTASGGLGLGAPRMHGAFMLTLGIIIGMPPFPSFQMIDGAVETASRLSPWMAGFFSVLWAVLAFRCGKGILEACWGPPRGPVAEGPFPDLLRREWSIAVGVPILLGIVGVINVFVPANTDGESHLPKGHHADLPFPSELNSQVLIGAFPQVKERHS